MKLCMRQHNTHLTNSVQSHDPLNFLFFGIKDLYSFFAFPYKSECVLLATKNTKTEREIIIKLITPFALLSQPLGGLENTLLWLKFSKKNKKSETTPFYWLIWERKRSRTFSNLTNGKLILMGLLMQYNFHWWVPTHFNWIFCKL